MKRALVLVLLLAVFLAALPNVIELAGQAGKIKALDELADRASSAGGEYDCIVVLGAAVRPDGTPSDMLRDRLDRGIELYNAGVAPKIVMSGDDLSDTSYDEVTNMKAYAVAAGVPSEDVFCDHAGLCTYDTAYRLYHVFGAKSAVLVSQRYHLYRALFDAQSFGVQVAGCASDQHAYINEVWYNVREAAARVSDYVKVRIGANATYLSEPVSLDQSGDVTTW